MSHRCALLFVAVLAVLAGCGGGRARGGLDALPGRSSASRPHTSAASGETTLDADPGLAADRRLLAVRAARTLMKTSPGAGDAELLRATFGELSLEAAPAGQASVDAWLEASRVRRGRPRPGDVAVFASARGVPRVAVVVEVHPDGRVEAVARTRGALRLIHLDPERPDLRRRNGRIVNTFVRAVGPGDHRGDRYLAGQLLTGVRTLLD